MHSLPSVKKRRIINNVTQTNTFPQFSTCRSILRYLTSVSHSTNEKSSLKN
jgi:hypothetical protein